MKDLFYVSSWFSFLLGFFIFNKYGLLASPVLIVSGTLLLCGMFERQKSNMRKITLYLLGLLFLGVALNAGIVYWNKDEELLRVVAIPTAFAVFCFTISCLRRPTTLSLGVCWVAIFGIAWWWNKDALWLVMMPIAFFIIHGLVDMMKENQKINNHLS
jgi:hypothetical protein